MVIPYFISRVFITSEKMVYMVQEDDNPPVGILLCTDYGETTVKYSIDVHCKNIRSGQFFIIFAGE